MKVKDYEEKEIRRSILNKVRPKVKTGKHGKGYIYIGGKVVAKVKIPNEHKNIMHHNKSQFIARDLKLDDEDFNKLVDCDLKGPGYYKKLTQVVS
jgi:hypothetical protein